MHQGMHGMIAHLHSEGCGDPLLNLPVGGEPIRLRQPLAELDQLVRRQGWPFAGGHVHGEQCRQPTLAILSQPASHGITIHAEERGDGGAALGLPAGQQIERMQALAYAMVALLLEPLLEVVGRLMDAR